MKAFENIYSPVQKVTLRNGVQLSIKREDLIHPEVSGNKWRKLKYYLEDFKQSGKEVILTFGGAFSNHLAATAALGKLTGIPTKALVRGDEIRSNPTLDFCRSCGMEIDTISRKDYAERDNPEFLRHLKASLPQVYVIEEGGKGPLGVKGCTEILDETSHDFDYVACSTGTGTLAAGLLLSLKNSELLCFPALKGGKFIAPAIARWLLKYQQSFSTEVDEKVLIERHLRIVDNYHFGGYGRVTDELVEFMNNFHREFGVLLDPVYTGKMLFGIFEMIDQGYIPEGSGILAIHSGGLQGIKGMNQVLKNKGSKLLDDEN